MYGLVSLSCRNEADRRIKRAHQCTLCNYLAEHYGNHARLYTTNETVFLYTLLDAQMEEKEGDVSTNCRFIHNNSKPSRALEYASAIAVMLGYSKILDSYYDERGPASRMLLALLKSQVKKAMSALEGLGFNPSLFSHQLILQHRLEERRFSSLSIVSKPSQRILGEIFANSAVVAGKVDNVQPLSCLGEDLGALLYALDGYSDIEQDFYRDRFNPFLVCRDVNDFTLKTSAMKDEVTLFCRERLEDISRRLKEMELYRYQELITRSLTHGLSNRAGQTIYEGSQPRAPSLGFNVLLPLSVLALKALVGQDQADGDMYDCCVWCCCDDQDPCPETSTPTGEPVIDYAVRTLGTGGAAAAVGAGAGILGGRLISRRGAEKPPEPEEDMVYTRDEFVEPDALETRIIDVPDELPEVPELDKSKIEDTTVDPGYYDTLVDDMGGKPPSKTVEEDHDIPEITKPDYPEDINDGVARGGMDHRDVWEWFMKNRGGEAKSPDTKPVFVSEESWKKPEEGGLSVWEKLWNPFRDRWRKYLSQTPEERAAEDAANAAAGKRARDHGAWGGKSDLNKALSDPTRPSEGDPKAALVQALRDRVAKPGVTGVRMTRGLLKMTGAGSTKTIIPKTRVPHMKNLGLSAMRATDQARKIGQGVSHVRDFSGVADGGLDLLSQTGMNKFTDTVSPDSTTIIDKSGVWQVEPAQQKAIDRFIDLHGRPPDPEKDFDVERWKNLVDSIREGE